MELKLSSTQVEVEVELELSLAKVRFRNVPFYVDNKEVISFAEKIGKVLGQVTVTHFSFYFNNS